MNWKEEVEQRQQKLVEESLAKIEGWFLSSRKGRLRDEFKIISVESDGLKVKGTNFELSERFIDFSDVHLKMILHHGTDGIDVNFELNIFSITFENNPAVSKKYEWLFSNINTENKHDFQIAYAEGSILPCSTFDH